MKTNETKLINNNVTRRAYLNSMVEDLTPEQFNNIYRLVWELQAQRLIIESQEKRLKRGGDSQ
jgi:hypothetical protein